VPRQWAVEAVRLDAKGAVEAGPEVLQRDGGGQLDKLRLVKMRAQSGEQGIRDVRRRGGHRLRQLQRRAFGIIIERAAPVPRQGGDLFVGDARVAAAGSVDVDSEGAADKRRYAQADQQA
jgi:hypothetical protein